MYIYKKSLLRHLEKYL